jgi:hypothetical protein
MGPSVDFCALSLSLAAFAGWTLSQFAVRRRVRWVNLLGGVGVLALFFSIVSPDDDLFQQELLRPDALSVSVSAHTRVVPGRSPADFSISAFVAAGDHVRSPRTGCSFVPDHPVTLETYFHASLSIHSPPTAS